MVAGDEGACGTVLVVDDDAGARQLVSATLAAAGFSVLAVEHGEEAAAEVARRRPQLAILDVNLPRVSGYELLRQLKAGDETLPVIFVSGERTESFDRVAGLMLGADDYLVKPVAPDELLARVRCVLRRATRRPDSERARLLTKRELEVLRLLATGNAQAEIARRLVISPKTVATHIEHILAKLWVRSRAQAVAVAHREHLVADQG
jgi:DNA-binding NarL/FixJ family response regulator